MEDRYILTLTTFCATSVATETMNGVLKVASHLLSGGLVTFSGLAEKSHFYTWVESRKNRADFALEAYLAHGLKQDTTNERVRQFYALTRQLRRQSRYSPAERVNLYTRYRVAAEHVFGERTVGLIIYRPNLDAIDFFSRFAFITDSI